MAFTTSTRIQNLINQSGSGAHNIASSGAITNAVNFANEYLEKLGVASTETDEGLLGAADLLGLYYLVNGKIGELMFRGQLQAAGSMRLWAAQLRDQALFLAAPFWGYSLRTTKAKRNRNWAFDRGGPLSQGSEAGDHQRTGDDV